MRSNRYVKRPRKPRIKEGIDQAPDGVLEGKAQGCLMCAVLSLSEGGYGISLLGHVAPTTERNTNV